MADYVQKVPIARTLNQFTTRKARGLIDLYGKSLPASVVSVVSSGIVNVKFEIANTVNSPYTLPNVTVPLMGPEYVRYPIQPGCKGYVTSADAYLGGMSGLGGGVADLALRGNLSALVFVPFGNSTWSPSEDPNSLILYGPNGVIIRNLANTSKVQITSTGSVVVAPKAGQPTAIQSDAQLTGQIKDPGGGTYSKPITTTDDVSGKDVNASANLVAGAMVSAPAAAFGSALIAGFAALTTAGGQNLGGGFTSTEFDNGTPASGATITPSPLSSLKQVVTNNVAGFNIAASGLIGDIELRIVNGASAGTPTFTGFSVQWPGDALDTVSGHQFIAYLYGFGGSKSAYLIKALQ